MNGQRFVDAFAKAAGRRLADAFEFLDNPLQCRSRIARRCHRVRCADLASILRMIRLGQMIGNVPQLVHLAPLDCNPATERRAHCPGQHLRAVQHRQLAPTAIIRQPALAAARARSARQAGRQPLPRSRSLPHASPAPALCRRCRYPRPLCRPCATDAHTVNEQRTDVEVRQIASCICFSFAAVARTICRFTAERLTP